MVMVTGKKHLQFMSSFKLFRLNVEVWLQLLVCGCHWLFWKPLLSGKTFKTVLSAGPETDAEMFYFQANDTDVVLLIKHAYLGSLYLVDRLNLPSKLSYIKM